MLRIVRPPRHRLYAPFRCRIDDLAGRVPSRRRYPTRSLGILQAGAPSDAPRTISRILHLHLVSSGCRFTTHKSWSGLGLRNQLACWTEVWIHGSDLCPVRSPSALARQSNHDVCLMMSNLNVLDQYVLSLHGTATKLLELTVERREFPSAAAHRCPVSIMLRFIWRPWASGVLPWIQLIVLGRLLLHPFVRGLKFLF